MRRLSDTITRLSALTDRMPGLVPLESGGHLRELVGFGTNPGALRGWSYVPDGLPADAGLVVVLHGCTQTAAGYDRGAGWSQLAERHGFALLFAEQQRSNNPNLCFNWYSPADTRRDGGEAQSIRQMIGAVVTANTIDPARVFITGLSAGGAMASVMLATYPELFAGGAIIAGLPFGCATTVPEAFDRMRGHGLPGEATLAAKLRQASEHNGRWPSIAVWHGTADRTVDVLNADAIISQWRAVHGVGATPDRVDTVDGHPHRAWLDAAGHTVIEEYRIAGMGHGTPLDTSDRGCGAVAPFMLEVGISSSVRSAQSWGLVPAAGPSVGLPRPERRSVEPSRGQATRTGVDKVIESALRSAGLLG